MASAFRELLEKNELGASIAFTKRMAIIDVAHDGTDTVRKILNCRLTVETSCYDSLVDVGHAGFDILAKLELIAIF